MPRLTQGCNAERKEGRKEGKYMYNTVLYAYINICTRMHIPLKKTAFMVWLRACL